MTDRAVPVLVAADLDHAANFWRYFGFEPVLQSARRLRLCRGRVEIEYGEGAPPVIDGIVHGAMCVILVADVPAWHDIFASTRIRWKAFGGPSLTSIGSAGWNRPAFCVTDRDHNLIWIVEDSPG